MDAARPGARRESVSFSVSAWLRAPLLTGTRGDHQCRQSSKRVCDPNETMRHRSSRGRRRVESHHGGLACPPATPGRGFVHPPRVGLRSRSHAGCALARPSTKMGLARPLPGLALERTRLRLLARTSRDHEAQRAAATTSAQGDFQCTPSTTATHPAGDDPCRTAPAPAPGRASAGERVDAAACRIARPEGERAHRPDYRLCCWCDCGRGYSANHGAGRRAPADRR
jgi:hypothetical protein